MTQNYDRAAGNGRYIMALVEAAGGRREVAPPPRINGDAPPPGVRAIPLTGGLGLVAWVEEADYEDVAAHRWHPKRARRGSPVFYACRSSKGRQILMHRQLMLAPPELLVDHANGDGLDNRRIANLRLATTLENNQNRGTRSASGWRGVTRTATAWAAKITVRGRSVHLGTFATARAAAAAYDARALLEKGQFARLNFPLGDQSENENSVRSDVRHVAKSEVRKRKSEMRGCCRDGRPFLSLTPWLSGD